MIVRGAIQADAMEPIDLFAFSGAPGKRDIMVVEHRLSEPTLDVTPTPVRIDAVVVRLQLADYPAHRFWEDGVAAPMRDVAAGETLFHDLRRGPRLVLDQAYHALHFHIPRAAFDAIANECNAMPIGELDYAPGVGVQDPVIANLGASIRSEAHKGRHSALFVEHLTKALATHVATEYGGMTPMSRGTRGGLAPWQARRAKDILSANLDGAVPLAEVARQCGLSIGHFSRAFRQSVGVTPHQWLVQRRLDAAKDLIRSCVPLSNVALSCGFADQSHLTRVFTRQVGASPGAWRREVQQ